MSNIELIEDDLFPMPEANGEGFHIDSVEKAEWALSKIASAEKRILDREMMADALIYRIKERLGDITKQDRDTVENMKAMLHPWAEVEIAKQGKTKHVKLLGGEVGFRQSPARLEVIDTDAALSSLPESCIRIKKEVDKTATKKLIETTGELPDGVELVPGEVRFYVEAKGLQIEEKK